MRRFLFTLVCLLPLSLVACAAEQPTPMPTAVVQVTATNTPVLPTATTQATDTPVPVTNTATPLPTDTATATPTLTVPPTHTALPTQTATATLPPTLTPTPPPPPTGRIYFLWDSQQLPNSGQGDPIQSLYLATPGGAPDDWQIEPVLDELYGWPITALSPDQTKLVLTVLEDFNGDGHISQEGHNRGFDYPNLYLYDLLDGMFQRLTDDYPQVHTLSWLSDNQTFSYQDGDTIFSFNLTDFSKAQYVGPFPNTIRSLNWSPDGNLLAIELHSGQLYLLRKDTGETVQVTGTPADYQSHIAWSPNSQWLASTTLYDAGLFIVNVPTMEIHVLVTPDYFSLPRWSPNGEKLAFTQTVRDLSSSLFLWDSNDLSTKLITETTFISDMVWTRDSSSLAVGYLDNDAGGILVVDSATGTPHELIRLEGSVTVKPIIWSIDEQWLLFFSQQEDESGLYLVHHSGGQAHFMMETTNTFEPYSFFWLP